MTEFAKFWDEKRAELRNDYLDENGEKASCWMIASQLGNLLHPSGKKPRLLVIQSLGTTASTVFSSHLVPLPYEGRREWMFHFVCSADKTVYDPMLEEPIHILEYPQKAFGKPGLAIVEDVSWVPTEQK